MQIIYRRFNIYLFIFCLSAVIVTIAASDATAQGTKSKSKKNAVLNEDAPRYVHEPDLKTLLPRFLTAQGFLDPKFLEAIAKPDAYYSNFYGIQALADATRDRIKSDFVPRFAEVAGEDEHTVTLKFKSGYTGKFYPHSSLKVSGTETPFDHVEISGATWQELLKNLADFRQILKIAKLEKHYLRPNPFYNDELTINKNFVGNTAPAVITVDPTLTALQTEQNAVVIYPEGVHGNVEGYNKFKQNVLDKIQFDWIGMEMLAPEQQKDLDAFYKAAQGTPTYEQARKALVDYFASSWNGRNGVKTTGEENYYFKIVDQMRERKTHVIGLEKSNLPYIIFRYGENLFGAAVRSYNWARLVPKTGKGLIFGGSGHMNNARPVNVQDFLKLLDPSMRIYAIEAIKMR